MTLSLTHALVSAVVDNGVAGEVGPSEWNAEHSTSMATGKLLGRSTAGTGAIEELSGSAVRTIATSAPVDALDSTGMQINGSCDVDQVFAAASTSLASGTAKGLIDCWQGKFVSAVPAVVVCQQIAPPGSPSFGGAFQNCLQMKATTADASLAAGEYFYLEHLIEGYRAQRLAFGASAAQAVSLGFWVYATISGTMTVALLNSAANRAIVHDVAINSATTWEYKTVTFSAGDTSGTWLKTNGTGLRVRLCFGSGSTFQGTADSWTASELFATSATTNFFATANNVAAVTGLLVVPGVDLPDSTRSPLIMRPFHEELERCKRYYWSTFNYGTAPAQNVGTNTGELTETQRAGTAALHRIDVRLPQTMRATPTMTTYNPSAANAEMRNETAAIDCSSSGTSNTTTSSTMAFATTNASGAGGDRLGIHISADARMT